MSSLSDCMSLCHYPTHASLDVAIAARPEHYIVPATLALTSAEPLCWPYGTSACQPVVARLLGTHAADESVSQLLMEAADMERLRGPAVAASLVCTAPEVDPCSGNKARRCAVASFDALRESTATTPEPRSVNPTMLTTA